MPLLGLFYPAIVLYFGVCNAFAQPPNLSCSTNITLATDPGQCSRSNVTYIVTADSGATIVCNPPSSSTFAKGTNLVSCTAWNTSGNTQTCSFTITVNAAPAGPVVLLGIDAEDGGPGGHGPISAWRTLVSSILNQAIGGSGILVIGGGKQSADHVTQFWNAIGTGTLQTITYVNSSNIANLSFSGFRMIGVASDVNNTGFGGLTVAENDALRDRAADIARFVNNGGGLLGFSSRFSAPSPAAGPYAYMAGFGALTLVSQDFNDLDATAEGLTIGVDDTLDISFWHQSFAAYPSFLRVLAYVAGTTNPAALGGSQLTIPLTCPNPVTVPCTSSITLTTQVYNAGCQTLAVTWKVDGAAVQTNTVPANSPNASVAMTHTYGVGNHIVTVTASDGNSSPFCTTIVTVNDAAPPIINCPGDIVFNASAGQCSAVVTYSVSASDSCSGITNVTYSPPSGSTFFVGSPTTVICTARNGVGESATCSFTVTVNDAEQPTIGCPANIVTNPPPGQFEAVVNFAPTATDNCPGVTMVCSPPSGSTFSNGTTTVACTATDAAGNIKACSFTVTVSTTNLAISALTNQVKCSGEIAVFGTVASGGGPYSYAWKLDNNPTGTNGSTLAVSTAGLSLGNHMVQVTVTGSQASASTSAILTVGGSTTATPLTNLTRCICESAGFTTTASGTGPFNYLWKKDGQALPGESGGSIVLQNLQSNSAGIYAVVVSGPCNSVTNSATLIVEGAVLPNPATFTNAGFITINDFSSATPYPSPINVKCASGTVRKVKVTLYGLNHTFPGDIDILLANPSGKAIKLMSDAGNYFGAEDVTLTFDSDVTNSLPLGDTIEPGTYEPTDYDANDTFPAPAPLPPYATNLSALSGIGLNGSWSLYVVDDSTLDAGNISRGWSVTIDWELGAPRLSSPLVLNDGRFQFVLTSEQGKTHVIEASTDLQTWIPISTNTLANASVVYVFPPATNSNRRFYRAIRCP